MHGLGGSCRCTGSTEGAHLRKAHVRRRDAVGAVHVPLRQPALLARVEVRAGVWLADLTRALVSVLPRPALAARQVAQQGAAVATIRVELPVEVLAGQGHLLEAVVAAITHGVAVLAVLRIGSLAGLLSLQLPLGPLSLFRCGLGGLLGGGHGGLLGLQLLDANIAPRPLKAAVWGVDEEGLNGEGQDVADELRGHPLGTDKGDGGHLALLAGRL